jgi:hypothetical protein
MIPHGLGANEAQENPVVKDAEFRAYITRYSVKRKRAIRDVPEERARTHTHTHTHKKKPVLQAEVSNKTFNHN